MASYSLGVSRFATWRRSRGHGIRGPLGFIGEFPLRSHGHRGLPQAMYPWERLDETNDGLRLVSLKNDHQAPDELGLFLYFCQSDRLSCNGLTRSMDGVFLHATNYRLRAFASGRAWEIKSSSTLSLQN